jgi:hypothetical protein
LDRGGLSNYSLLLLLSLPLSLSLLLWRRYRDDREYRAGVERLKEAVQKFGLAKVQAAINGQGRADGNTPKEVATVGLEPAERGGGPGGSGQGGLPADRSDVGMDGALGLEFNGQDVPGDDWPDGKSGDRR